MPMFAAILSKRFGYDCTVLFSIDPELGTINPNINHNIPGLHLLAKADLMVIFARFRELPDKDMKPIVDYVNAGKPVIGIRNATHAFRYTKKQGQRLRILGLEKLFMERRIWATNPLRTWVKQWDHREATLAHAT